MKFIGRESELARLAEISRSAATSGYLTMITGRRRVGKTTLVKHFLQQNGLPHCYFFVSRKQPRDLLNEFSEILAETFPEIAELHFDGFDRFFKFLFQKMKIEFQAVSKSVVRRRCRSAQIQSQSRQTGRHGI